MKKIAIVGGNAKAVILSGGGSAALKPSYFVSPYEGIVNALGSDVEITYSEGARCKISIYSGSCSANNSPIAYMQMPTLDYDIFTSDGKRGWIGEWFTHENDDSMTPVGAPVRTQYFDETRIFIRFVPPAISTLTVR